MPRFPFSRLPKLVLAGSILTFGLPAMAQQTGTITLTGTVAQQCSVVVTATTGAVNLDLSSGTRRIEVGSGVQTCNKKAGYTIRVSSANCATGIAGAKLVGATSAELLPYSVEFNNPTTGGSQATVTGLLASACTGTSAITGRDVSNSKITSELSRIFVNYTGDTNLAADTYTDTLTISMIVK